MKGLEEKGNEMSRNVLSHCTFWERIWREEEEMRLGSRLIQPPGKKGSFRWLIFRCNCIAPWHQPLSSGGAPNRAHPQHLHQHITASGSTSPFLQQLDVEASARPMGKYISAAHIYRESIMWWPWDSSSNMRNSVDCPIFFPFSSFLLSAQLCFLIHCAPYEEH